MGETITGLANIAKHFEVSAKTVQSWLGKGMPHLNSAGTITVSIEAAETWLENHQKNATVFDGNFSVQIVHQNEVIWCHGQRDYCPYGMTCLGYLEDGTIEQIEAALKLALEQISFRGELKPKEIQLHKTDL